MLAALKNPSSDKTRLNLSLRSPGRVFPGAKRAPEKSGVERREKFVGLVPDGFCIATFRFNCAGFRSRLVIYFVRSEHLAAAQVVPPSLKPILVSGALTIRVASRPGPKYQLQSTPVLPGQWINLGDPKVGNGSELEFSVGQPNENQSFYRLKME